MFDGAILASTGRLLVFVGFSPMVDCVISSREIYEDYAGDFPCFKAIFDVLGSTRFAGAEASLLWYKDMFDNGRQAVQYQALV